MDDPDDLDALAAREAALTSELADKQRERDEAARLVAEARGDQPAPATSPRRRRIVAIGAAVALVAAGIAIVIGARRSGGMTAPVAGTLSCEQIEPDHLAAERATEDAYRDALAANSVAAIAPLRRESITMPEATDHSATEKVAAWTPFADEANGRPRTLIAGELRRPSATVDELVEDAHGNVWRAERHAKFRTIRTVSVDACSWGCWGGPPSGMPQPETFERDVWVLPDGDTYRGDLEIAYDAPTLVITYTRFDCPLPP